MSLKNLFLNNIEETTIPQEAPVTGRVPNWLTGTYYKVGNGKYQLPSGFDMAHMYDGYSILYQYKIQDSKVTFKSRYLNSDAYIAAMEVGKPLFDEYATRRNPNPNHNIISRLISRAIPSDISDNNWVIMIVYKDKVYACGEGYYIHQIDPDTLQSIAKIDLSKAGVLGIAAHYLYDDDDGAMYNLGMVNEGGLKFNYFKFNALSVEEPDFDPLRDVKIIASGEKSSLTSVSFSHSFGMTKNYFIQVEQPLKINIFTLMVGQLQGKCVKDVLRWHPDDKVKFHVTCRKTGNLIQTKYISSPFFFFHTVNAFEDEGYIVIDIVTNENPEFLDYLMLEKLKNGDYYTKGHPVLKRFVLPVIDIEMAELRQDLIKLETTKALARKVSEDLVLVSPETLFSSRIDCPSINSKFIGKKYRFLYFPVIFEEGENQKQLFKLDLATQEVKSWKSKQESHFATEPIFVANPEGVDEDDGVVIVAIADAGDVKKSMIVFLDGKSFTEIGRAEFQSGINIGNHGTFKFQS